MTLLVRFAMFAMLMLAACAHADPLVVLVSSERTAAYTQAVDALTTELEKAGVSRQNIADLALGDTVDAASTTPRLYIALGARASEALVMRELKVPVLSTLLPRTSYERILRQSGRKPSAALSALYLDQPVARQLDLIRLALPQARRIGLLWGPESQQQANELRAAMPGKGLTLIGADVQPGEPFFPALRKVLDEADLLLAVADPQLYNSASIQNLLLSTFRARIPMVAFSPAYVRAGAVLAVYSTPAQIGTQTATMARNLLAGKPLLLNPQYPQEFVVGVNEHVARSLDLSLDAQALTERLRQLERAP